MEDYPERDHSWKVKDPLLFFVLDGVRYAVSHVNSTGRDREITWGDVRKDVLHYFPDAEIILEEEQRAE